MTPPFIMRFSLFYSLNITTTLLVLWAMGLTIIPWLVVAIPAAVSFVQTIDTFD